MLFVAIVGAFLAFTLSASAGLGGSLILVPVLILTLGTKEGIALSAFLLAANNVMKVFAYRETIPLRAVLLVICMTILGAAFGSKLLLSAPEGWIDVAVIVSIGLTLTAEKARWHVFQGVSAPLLALFSGITSGFSGSSGPLKGVALRNLALERQYMVGAASMVSLAGDLTKSLVFWQSNILDHQQLLFLLSITPLMPAATLLGRHINRRLGEQAYATLFWGVMVGYSIRILAV